MKIYYAIFTILLLSSSLSAQNEGITFEDSSWDNILDKAQKENKLIFLDAYASWCGPCKWMSANVFPQKKVGEFMNEHFVNAKIDMEKGEGPAIAKKYGVRAYPTYLIVNGNGELVHRFCGSMEAEPFIAKVKIAMDKDSNFAAVQHQFNKSKLSKESALGYFTLLEGACMGTDEAAKNIYSSLDKELVTLENWSEFIATYPPAYESEYFNYTLENLNQIEGPLKNDIAKGLQSSAKSYLISMLRSDEYSTAVNKVKALPFNTKNVVAETNYFYFRENKDWGNFADAANILASGTQSENANFLNSAAWTLYENVEDEEDLKMALGWMEKALEYERNYAYLDTYAALLFKTGQNKKGKKVAKEAIEIAITNGNDYSGTEELINEYSE